MAGPDIYCDQVKFGHAVREMAQVAEQIKAAADALGRAVTGELGPPGLEQAALAAAAVWAAGAGVAARAAAEVGNNVSLDIAEYTAMDRRGQLALLRAIAGEDVPCRTDFTGEPQRAYATPDGLRLDE